MQTRSASSASSSWWRVRHQPPDDLELALHASGQAFYGFEHVGAQGDHLGQLPDLLAIGGRHQSIERAIWVEAVEDRVEANVFLASQVHVQRGVLEDDAHMAAHGARLSNDVVACDAHAP